MKLTHEFRPDSKAVEYCVCGSHKEHHLDFGPMFHDEMIANYEYRIKALMEEGLRDKARIRELEIEIEFSKTSRASCAIRVLDDYEDRIKTLMDEWIKRHDPQGRTIG